MQFSGSLPLDNNGNQQVIEMVGYKPDGTRSSTSYFGFVSVPMAQTVWHADYNPDQTNGYDLFFVASIVNGVVGPERLFGFQTYQTDLIYQATTINTDLSKLPAAILNAAIGHAPVSATHSDAAVLAAVHDSSSDTTPAAGTDTTSAAAADTTAAAGTATTPAAAADTTPTAGAVTSHTVVGEHDAFKGTTGHDTVDLNADPASYFKETTAHIEGSTAHPTDATGTAPAVNTLHLTGDHQILDLTSLTGKTAAAKISGIEVIDLGGHSNNLKLSLTDVLNLGEQDLFQKDGHQQLMVNGSNGDTVDLSNSHIAGVAEGQWQAEGTAVVGGVTYNVYEHSSANTELLVEQPVRIEMH